MEINPSKTSYNAELCCFFQSALFLVAQCWPVTQSKEKMGESGPTTFGHIQLSKYTIPMGRNCASLVADLFLYCYERDFMDSLNHDNQADVIEAFKSTSRYLDDLLNIDNPYFEGMVNQIYLPELQLNKVYITDTEAPFLDLHFSVANGFVSSKIYDMRDDFDFDIVNFPFLDGDVPRRDLRYRSPLFRSTSFCCKWICFF